MDCEKLSELNSYGLIKSRLSDVLVVNCNYLQKSYKDIGAKLSISSQYCYSTAGGNRFHLGRLSLEVRNSFSTMRCCKKGTAGRAVAAPCVEAFKTWLESLTCCWQ